MARPPTFTGEEAGFEEWRFRFMMSMALLGLDEPLREAAKCSDEIAYDKLRPEMQNPCKIIYAVLVTCVQGKALSLVRLCATPDGHHNGYEAWRRLTREYEPPLSTRAIAQLSSILTPTWTTEGWLDQWRKREQKLSQYEADQSETISDMTKCAVLMRWAPQGVRTFLRATPED